MADRDDDVVARAKDGDPEAWRRLHRAHAGRLLAWLSTRPSGDSMVAGRTSRPRRGVGGGDPDRGLPRHVVGVRRVAVRHRPQDRRKYAATIGASSYRPQRPARLRRPPARRPDPVLALAGQDWVRHAIASLPREARCDRTRGRSGVRQLRGGDDAGDQRGRGAGRPAPGPASAPGPAVGFGFGFGGTRTRGAARVTAGPTDVQVNGPAVVRVSPRWAARPGTSPGGPRPWPAAAAVPSCPCGRRPGRPWPRRPRAWPGGARVRCRRRGPSSRLRDLVLLALEDGGDPRQGVARPVDLLLLLGARRGRRSAPSELAIVLSEPRVSATPARAPAVQVAVCMEGAPGGERSRGRGVHPSPAASRVRRYTQVNGIKSPDLVGIARNPWPPSTCTSTCGPQPLLELLRRRPTAPYLPRLDAAHRR